MSSRGTRNRGAKGRISYVETPSDESDFGEPARDDSEEEDWTPKHQEKKRRTNKAKANKDHKRKPESDSESDASSGEDDDEDEDDDLHLATGVDFSKKLPYEIVAEIFSYLSPPDLLVFDSSSRSFRSILSGPSSRPLWAKARENFKIPSIDPKFATERQLANLLFNKQCESCGVGQVETPDICLCKRFCTACREANWIKLEDAAKTCPDLHPATTQAVRTTKHSAKTFRWHASAYALFSDLHAASEHLEHLELLDSSKGSLHASFQGEKDEAEEDEEDDEDDGDEGGEEISDSAANKDSTRSRTRTSRRSTRGTVRYNVDSEFHEGTTKKMKMVRALKRSWRPAENQMGQRLEQELQESWSPLVREYVKKQEERRKEWEPLAKEIERRLFSVAQKLKKGEKEAARSVRRVFQLRRESVEKKLLKKGFKTFYFASEIWTKSDLLNHPFLLTNDEWRKTKKRFVRLAGESAADRICQIAVSNARQRSHQKMLSKDRQAAERKLARLEALDRKDHDQNSEDRDETEEGDDLDDDGGKWREEILSKPKTISKKVWKYILPPLQKRVEAELSHSDDDEGASVERNPLSMLSEEGRQHKKVFFAEKYRKMFDMQETNLFPLFSRFVHLPTVKELYFGNPLYATRSNVKEEMVKCDRIWEMKFDDILEEAQEYAADAVVHVVKTVLAATGQVPEEDVEQLDVLELLGDDDQTKPKRVDDGFFTRPTSFVFCAECHSFFGNADEVFAHQHDDHNSPLTARLAPSLSKAQLFPLELSIQASIAVSAMFEVAQVDPEGKDAEEKLERKIGNQMLVWENMAPGKGRKACKGSDWADLVDRIHRAALEAEAKESVLAGPILSLRKPNAQERRREMRNGWFRS